MSASIMSVNDLLSMNLRIPGYQRPYRWSKKNVADLLGDINNALSEAGKYHSYKYRIGSVILHRNAVDRCLDLVDGQQRLITLALLMLCLDSGISFPLLENSAFSSVDTQANIRANYEFIAEWVGYQSAVWRRKALEAFGETLEAVVIIVDRVEEAFQLFDSQNTRGRSLDPHDLLKAYHLRAMRDMPYEMRHVVTRWEEFSSDDVRELFARYLFPILNWERGVKTVVFTAKEIDAYKGISSSSGYSYAERARRAAPCFQLDEPFIEGEDFFLMAEHYLRMREDIKLEMKENFKELYEKWLERKSTSIGYQYARELFYCVLLAYYDRFHNFDERAVKKLFTWAFMVRVDMQTLGFDTINKYAVGEGSDRYTNSWPMFSLIARARRHTDIADIRIRAKPAQEFEGLNTERQELGRFLLELASGGAR